MYLFFDTETTGLPRNYKAPVSQTSNWPRMVQIAWIMAGEDGNEVEENSFIVRPEGYTIPVSSMQVHGISQHLAETSGVALSEVLHQFARAVEASTLVVGHNVTFDEKIVGAEFIRKEVPHQLWHRERICTKVESTDFCQLPGKYGFKWPTLDELHRKLFGKTFPNAHDALGDVRATKKCYFALQKLGVV